MFLSRDTATQATKDRITASVRRSVHTALKNPAAEPAERLRIFGLLLDPQLAAVDRAIHGYESGNPFATTEREQIESYVTRAIEKKLLGASGSGDLVDLGSFVENSPVAWLDTFARSCIRHGITEVRRGRQKQSSTPASSILWSRSVDSAEEAFLMREHEDVVRTVSAVVETWDSRDMTKHEKVRETGEVLRTLRGVPPVHVAGMATQRWLAELVDSTEGPALLMGSLHAFRDLASGDPTWEQMDVDDRLLDLWIDYDAEQVLSLIASGENVVAAIVRGQVAIPPRPNEAQRVAVRRIAKGMSDRTGWSSLVMAVEKAWVATYFSARGEFDRSGKHTDEELEEARVVDASHWAEAAQAVVEFDDCPLGAGIRSIDDVSHWLFQALGLATRR